MLLLQAAKLALAISFVLALVVIEIYSAIIRNEGQNGDPVVQIQQGMIEGMTEVARDGRTFLSFKGIPFGKVPKRFNNPEPADGWTGTKSTKEFPPACPQINFFSNVYSGVEDCLGLNVFVPVTNPPKEKLPVMFFIYGGAFLMGQSKEYQPIYFMDEDVILVTPHYRLSAFGFLNAGIKGASGNQAMKDLVLALKWTKQNIAAFGGDPNRVTIFGVSAGAAAVANLVASPMAAGLFQGAMALSGAATLGWSSWPDPEFNEPKKLAIAVDCPTSNMEYMVECLRKTDPQVLAMASGVFKDNVWFNRSTVPLFAPSIETYKESENDPNVFLDESAEVSVEKGKLNKVPYLTGFVFNEGLTLHAAGVLVQPEKTKQINEQWGRVAPEAMFYWSTAKDPCKVSSKIRQLYFQDKPISIETVGGLENMYGDSAFHYPGRKAALRHAQYAPSYLYNFTREVSFSIVDIFKFYDVFKPGTVSKPPTHGDDVQYYFNIATIVPLPLIKKGSPDYDFSVNMVKFLVSFARDGKPTHTWGSKHKGEFEPLKPTAKDDGDVKYIMLDNDITVERETEEFTNRMNILDGICRDDLNYCRPLK